MNLKESALYAHQPNTSMDEREPIKQPFGHRGEWIYPTVKSISVVTQGMTNIIKKLAINLALLMRSLSIVANKMSVGKKSIICLRKLSRLQLI